MSIALKAVELGVCQAPTPDTKIKTGKWGFHVVKVPATTPEEKLLEEATRSYLRRHDDYDDGHVYHTWVQSTKDIPASESEEEE